MNITETLQKAIDTYGEREQSAMAMEECGELIRAVNKMHRDPNAKNRQNLIEEIADVSIMMNQLLMMYDIDENEVEDVYTDKICRLRLRLEEVNNK